MANDFLVSVADAVLRDPTTGNAIAFGKTNISSAFTLSMTNTEARGGKGNPLLYNFFHDRKLEVKVESAAFNKIFLGLNVGNLVANGVVAVTQTECVQLTAGVGAVTLTPVGNVTVFLPDGTVQTVTPSTKAITVSGGGGQKVDAVYITNTTADKITIETAKPPSVVDLTLIADVRDNTGVIKEYLQINIPRFQVSGNYTLSFAANGISNQSLDGSALVSASTDCTAGDQYGSFTWVPAAAAAIPVSSIAAVPSTLSFSVAAGLPATKQISLLGIRGGTYANANITTSASYARASGCACFTVGANTGVVTAGSGTDASATAYVTATYYDTTNGSLVDTVRVTATA